MKCAIYARYSTDQQRPESIEDQIRKCRGFAARRGWEVLEEHVYSDSAVSGASTAGRENFLRMVEIAKSKPKPFDYILVDDTKRFARDVVTLVQNFKILKFHGVCLYFVSDGIDGAQKTSQFLLTILGGVGEQDLEYIAQTTHRGLEGQAIKGFNTGGKIYGYTSYPVTTGEKDRYGKPIVKGYRMKINQNEARIVRRIFEEYATGRSPREIVKQLNKERIPSPRANWKGGKRSWSFTAITGARDKGTGILNNELYIGRKIWNRSKWRKDPETGKRKRFERPREEWQVFEIPELRIIPQELWDKVKARQEQVRKHIRDNGGFQFASREYAKYLFTGMLKCECGANYITVAGSGDPYYGCSFHRNRGEAVCANRLRVRRTVLERSILDLFKDEILGKYLPALVEEVNIEFRKSMIDSVKMREEVAKKIEKVDGETENIKEAIRSGMVNETTSQMLREIEEKKTALSKVLAELEELAGSPLPEISEDVVKQYVESLGELLYTDPRAARLELRKHIEGITLRKKIGQNKEEFLEAEVKVLPQGILQVFIPQRLTVVGQMVAGGGFEPPTFGL